MFRAEQPAKIVKIAQYEHRGVNSEEAKVMNARMIAVLIVLASLIGWRDPASGNQLADAAAKALIERWLELSLSLLVDIKLGPLVVVSKTWAGEDPTDLAKGRLSQIHCR